ncbi:solute carrier family 38 (sodium-coupled neutral amino acid transporter), member 7/8 [Marchantia polymorpha subsp. ruderalis]|uniref:Amino acid transporter transmembrane domain-containing protein n=2 Tax=Marchantia polymorpha TaxID=3197 RepID=A0A2R6XB04_MARPO|nr:hypothetical protein MARPO_0026s0132 [Marchantia polymorpha]BBN02052.1 hypothetical protein Mp_2g12390 [Marchantia polymorpha subsp. ruderalis]|eukprot:PTQ43268.1 hypothetical protein MARPO_0026s0132 [Marchantia polymorpha]
MEAITGLAQSKRNGKNESPWVSVFNLCNAAIGAGVLSFPYGFRQTGVVGGLFFTGIIWVIEVFALCLLVRVAEKYNSQSYQQMVLSALGPNMAVLTSLVMLILLYGGGISYLLITGDVFEPVFADLFGESSYLANRRVVILFFAFVVILPLAMKTTLKALKYSSVISIVMLTYLTIALVIIGISSLISKGFPSDILVWRAGQHAFIIIDIVVFAFQCHIQVVPIFAELAEMPKPFFGNGKGPLEERLLDDEVLSQVTSRQRSERVKRMDAVIFVSMSICLIGYCMVGEFGYLIFPDVDSDVLKNFGNANVFMNFARIGMAVVAMVCYPLQSHPARSIVDDAYKAISKAPVHAFSWTRHIVITLIFFVSTLAVALIISDLGTVFSIVGSTGGVMVVFIIPGVLLIRGIYSPPVGYVQQTIDEEEAVKLSTSTRTGSQKCVQIVGGTLIIAFGLLIFSATSYVTATGMIS